MAPVSECSGCLSGWLGFALFLLKYLAAIDPTLHSDYSISRSRFGESVLDIRAQCVQRQAPLQIPLRARDFISIEAATYSHLDPFAAETQSGVYRLAHSPTEAHALFQLQGNRFRDQLGIQFVAHEDAYAARMVEQLCYIERYRREVSAKEGREIDSATAAMEWIAKYAANFPHID